MSRRVVLSTIGAVALAALVFVGGASGARTPRVRSISGQSQSQKRFLEIDGLESQGATPPTDAQCRASRPALLQPPGDPARVRGRPAHEPRRPGKGPDDRDHRLLREPDVQSDLETFDAGYGLPDPPSFKILAPLGTVPFNPTAPGSDRLGRGDDPRRRVGARDGPEGKDRAADEPGRRDRGRPGPARVRLPHQLRARPSPRERHLRELGRDREHAVHPPASRSSTTSTAMPAPRRWA